MSQKRKFSEDFDSGFCLSPNATLEMSSPSRKQHSIEFKLKAIEDAEKSAQYKPLSFISRGKKYKPGL